MGPKTAERRKALLDTRSIGSGPTPDEDPTRRLAGAPEPVFFFPERLPPGSTLDDRYEVSDYITSGGFADIYRGVKADTGMKVALKVLRALKASKIQDEAHRRFLLDARIAACIDHPNVVTILACHERMVLRLPDGKKTSFDRPFIVMELLEGWSLADELRVNGPMCPERALRLMSKCLEGLAESHKRNIIHKDLKPSNLFLSQPSRLAETLKILDFGIARVIREKDSLKTATGEFYCTPRYAAPEYLESQNVTPALDVYQMGLVLTEMITGKPVVEAAFPMGCVKEHAEGIVLPGDLEQGPLRSVLSKAIEREPSKRYEDADAMCKAIRGLTPTRAMARREKPEKKRSSGALPTVVLVIALVLVVWSSPPERLNRGAEEVLVPTSSAPEIDLDQRLCHRGSPRACVRVTRERLRQSPAGAELSRAAFEALSLACDQGVGEGCLVLGQLFEEGRRVPLNLELATEYYQRACDHGARRGCESRLRPQT